VPLIGPDQYDALRAQVAAHPDATLAEHCARWAAEQGQAVSVPTMCRLVRRLGLPLKKSR
jgi:transposase